MIKVPYAEWPESQLMLFECKYAHPVGDSNAAVCLKVGKCSCLKDGRTKPEDRREDIQDEQEQSDARTDLPYPHHDE